MKKLFLHQLELQDNREARMDFGKELNIVKISYEEALGFSGKFETPEAMFAHYGHNRRLQPGEHYSGYIAIWYATWLQRSAYMSGTLVKASPYEVNSSESYIRAALEEGAYWKLQHEETAEGVPIIGCVRYIDNFQQCRYAEFIRDEGLCPQGTTPEQMAKQLKEKILNGAINKASFEVTDEEFSILQAFHGKITLRKYFSISEA